MFREWPRTDRLLALALLAHEASLCPDCGHPRDEAADPLHDSDNPSRVEEYVVTGPVRDHACTALSRARKTVDDDEMAHPDGLRFGISLKPINTPT